MASKKMGMSISKKLLLSYLVLVIIIIMVGVGGVVALGTIYTNGNEIYVNNLRSVEFLKSINQNIKEIDRCITSMMTDLDKEYHDSYRTEIQVLQQENLKLMDEYETLSVTTLEKRRYNQCRLSILTFDKMIDSIVENINDENVENAVLIYEQEFMPVKACTDELVEAVVELATKSASRKNEDNKDVYRKVIIMIIVMIAAAFIIAMFISVRMSVYFTGKLGSIQRMAKRLSEYNVSDDIMGVENDEFGETMQALNDSQFMMRELLEKIIDESTIISDTGEEVSLAVRKSNQKIEETNVKVYNAETKSKEIQKIVHETLENRELDEYTVKLLRDILQKAVENNKNLIDIQAELTSVVMYLEQIGITSDYQNEIANTHKEQVTKFRV